MRLERITVQNFKSISPEGVTISVRSGMAALVGRNNAGKSNILEAVQFVASSKNPRYLRYDRAWLPDPAQPLVVELEFSGADYGDGKKLGLSDVQCRQLVPPSRRGPSPKVGHITLRLAARAAPDESSPDDEDDGEGGAKTEFVVVLGEDHEVRKTERIRKLLVRSIGVPAVRDQAQVLTPSVWTPYGQMLRDLLGESNRLDPVRALIEQVSAGLQAVLGEEATAITEAARSTAFVEQVHFKLTKNEDPLELLRNVSLGVTFGGRTDDVSSMGTGTQSAIMIGILELCLRHKATFGVRLFVVEEPELYLHPHAQRHIGRILRAIGEASGSCVLLTTHSSEIVTGLDIESVVRVDRGRDGHTRVQQVPQGLSADPAERVLSPSTAEMMFSDRAVLVEGASEFLLLPVIARLVGEQCDFDRSNISVVDVTGKGSFSRFATFLGHLGIPWRVVADLDALRGRELEEFREQAGVTPETPDEEAVELLRAVNVCVLRHGEIEDYYPHAVLAEIGGCHESEVASRIAMEASSTSNIPTLAVLGEVICAHREEIKSLPEEKLRKVVRRWHAQAMARLQAEQPRGTVKRSDAMSRWLSLSKPAMARAVADRLAAAPEQIPETLRGLVRWLVEQPGRAPDAQEGVT